MGSNYRLLYLRFLRDSAKLIEYDGNAIMLHKQNNSLHIITLAYDPDYALASSYGVPTNI
jgi:hypothetical protein